MATYGLICTRVCTYEHVCARMKTSLQAYTGIRTSVHLYNANEPISCSSPLQNIANEPISCAKQFIYIIIDSGVFENNAHLQHVSCGHSLSCSSAPSPPSSGLSERMLGMRARMGVYFKGGDVAFRRLQHCDWGKRGRASKTTHRVFFEMHGRYFQRHR